MRGVYKPPGGYKTFGHISAATKGTLKTDTLLAMAKHRDPFVKGATRLPDHPVKWVVPDPDAERIITEGKRIRELQGRGYNVKLIDAAGELGVAPKVLRERALRQEFILGTWTITDKTRQLLREKGFDHFPRLKKPLSTDKRPPKKLTEAIAGQPIALAGQAPVEWVNAWDIHTIDGALRPAQYADMVRYHIDTHGSLPPWAKQVKGHWVYDKSHIAQEIADRRTFMTITEMKKLFDTSDSTIHRWERKGVIKTKHGPNRKPGQSVLAYRDHVMSNFPYLQRKLETPGAVGIRLAKGKRVRPEAIERTQLQRKWREDRAYKRKLASDRVLREAKRRAAAARKAGPHAYFELAQWIEESNLRPARKLSLLGEVEAAFRRELAAYPKSYQGHITRPKYRIAGDIQRTRSLIDVVASRHGLPVPVHMRAGKDR